MFRMFNWALLKFERNVVGGDKRTNIFQKTCFGTPVVAIITGNCI